MATVERSFDQGIVEAEENFLIDCQFLLEELMVRKKVSRSELATKTGISRARLSQLMSAEANPTAKTIARLVHALGERITLSCGSDQPAKCTEPNEVGPRRWKWEERSLNETQELKQRARRIELMESVKASVASNDNYRSRARYWEEGTERIFGT